MLSTCQALGSIWIITFNAPNNSDGVDLSVDMETESESFKFLGQVHRGRKGQKLDM